MVCTEANGVGVLGGGGVDTISATFGVVSANASVANTFSGAKVGGNKGADELYVRVIGTSDEVRVNGNSGNDTVTVSAEADNVSFAVAGGKGDDLITAAFVGGNSSDAATVAGSLGNDTVNVKFSGGHVSGLLLNGASGDDSLVFSNQGAVISAGQNLELLGGTGADTITVNLGADLVITGASGFVADLGEPDLLPQVVVEPKLLAVLDVNLQQRLAPELVQLLSSAAPLQVMTSTSATKQVVVVSSTQLSLLRMALTPSPSKPIPLVPIPQPLSGRIWY